MSILDYSQSFLWHPVANRMYYDVDMNHFLTPLANTLVRQHKVRFLTKGQVQQYVHRRRKSLIWGNHISFNQENLTIRCTRSTSVELVKHIDPIESILDISWITREPPGKCLWLERWTRHISNIQIRGTLIQRAYLPPCWLHGWGAWINRIYGSNENSHTSACWAR